MPSQPHPTAASPGGEDALGPHLRRIRVNAGLSIDEVSKKIGITAARLEAIEKDQALLSKAWFKELKKLYKVPHTGRESLALLLRFQAARMRHYSISITSAYPADAPVPKSGEPVARASSSAGITKQPVATGIFISYRRSDQAAMAGRIFDKLSMKFNDRVVFMDVDSIDIGVDFVEVLEQTLELVKAMIVVIGPDWLTACDAAGRRRLDYPNDFVRLEIETAFRRKIRVMPILVEGATMPHAEDLPRSIRDLARRNGATITHERFGSDVSKLISTLEHVLRPDAEVSRIGGPPAGRGTST